MSAANRIRITPVETLLLALAGIGLGLVALFLQDRDHDRVGGPLLLIATGLLIAAVVTVVARNV